MGVGVGIGVSVGAGAITLKYVVANDDEYCVLLVKNTLTLYVTDRQVLRELGCTVSIYAR